MIIYETPDGFVVDPGDGGPVLSRCPCCGKRLPERRHAEYLLEAIADKKVHRGRCPHPPETVGELMAKDSEHVEVTGEPRGNTAQTILWYVEEVEEEMWFPRSQVEESSDGTSLLVPRWLALKKGLA